MKNAFFITLASIFLSILAFSAIAEAQTPAAIELNKKTEFTLAISEVKQFSFVGKRGEYFEIKTDNDNPGYPFFELYAPNGEELFDKQNGLAPALTLPMDGTYILKVFISKDSAPEGDPGPYKVSVTLSNEFALPKGSKLTSSKRINGYQINVYRSEESFSTSLEILKSGARLVYLLGESMIPFEINEGIVWGEGAAAKTEKKIWMTPDKTGDGVPDVAIQYYSGGAHCCYDYYFFELGDNVVQRPTLNTADAGVSARSVLPGGGIRVRTADMTFAYWNIHFAGSPAPTVMVDFKKGVWRPNFAAMKKPAPAAIKLKAMAAKAKRLMNNKPYKGDEFAGLDDGGYIFEEAFWGTMLELIYTGNEKEAWKYFDDVWPKSKPGKEIFKKDFTDQLNKSEFYKMILEDRRASNPAK